MTPTRLRRFLPAAAVALAVLATAMLATVANAQQIKKLDNGTFELRFRSGCIVHYDGRGKRMDSLPACTSDELQQADYAAGTGAVAGTGGATTGGGTTTDTPLIAISDGAGRASYANGCQVFYDAGGKRTSDNGKCVGDQVRRADITMAAYRDDLGLDGQGGTGGGSSETPAIAISNGLGRASFANGCQVFYAVDGKRTGDNGRCANTQVRRADSAMATYRHDQGLDDQYGSPVIALKADGYGRASFADGCQVFYDSWGDRTSDNDDCTASQVRRADEAMARYRYDQGLDDDPYGDDGSTDSAVLVLGEDRYGWATYPNGCQVFYDPWGDRTSYNGACVGTQVRRADDAMARYRRDQGLDGGSASADPPVIRISDGYGRASFTNGCQVFYDTWGYRTSDNDRCIDSQLRQADQAMAQYRRDYGLN